MDLFDFMGEASSKKESPLASRLRPESLDEIVGQKHILSKDKLLYRAIRADKLSSVILYGPPGTGKTTIAKVIAHTTEAEFVEMNATMSGKKDMEEAIGRAKEKKRLYGKKTILFIDEIHRFNKAQQDYLLPYVEDGTVTLVGATTENPYFEVNSALLSRSSVFELKPLSSEDIKELIRRAEKDPVKGMGAYHAELTEEAVSYLASVSDGDARAALNAVELGILTTDRSPDGIIHFGIEVARESIQKRVLRYDKNGDQHYDTISAFIKSMRGSDPDAAVYYLARMLSAGEDIKFIARRIMIAAAEDVGLANPAALVVAESAAAAAERVGLPEAELILSEAALVVATSPKSNASTEAIYQAKRAVSEIKVETLPNHLKDAHYTGAEALGHGTGYLYAHDFKDHYVEQQYLPDEVKDERFYIPSHNGEEERIREWFSRIRPGLWKED